MAQEVLVRIVVDDGDVNKATSEIEKLGGSIEKVEDTSKKAGKATKTAFDGASDSVDNLKGGLQGGVTEVGKLTKATKKGGAAMRAAFISTGIGAFVVLLGLIVSNWDNITAALDTQNKKIKEQHELLKISKELLDSNLERISAEKKLSEARGENIDELILKEEKLLEARVANRKETLENTVAELKLAQQRFNEITFFEELGQVFGIDARTQDDLDAINALKTAVADAGTELAKTELQLENFLNPKKPKTPKIKPVKRDKAEVIDFEESGIADPFQEQKELDARRLEALQEGTEEFRNIQNESNLAEVEAFFETEDAKTRIAGDAANERLLAQQAINRSKLAEDEETAKKNKEIAEEETKAKLLLLDAVGGGLSSLSEIAGRETGAGKALAVASSLINTYAAITGQLKAFSGIPVPGYAIAQAVATGLSGFAAVKNILKVKVPYDKSSGNGSFSGGGGAGQSQAPAFNVVGTGGVNQLAQSLSQDQAPIQAFVVGGDISSQQEFERNIVETSSI